MSNLEDLYNEEKANSPYIKLADGESFEGQFVDVVKTTGQFGETRRYAFIANGIEKTLDNKGFGLLNAMMEQKVEEGDTIKLTRTGEGTKTRYKVEVLTKAK